MLHFFLLVCTRRLVITFGLVVVLVYAADSQTVPSVYWYAPEDGGTPRNPERIVKVAPSEYIIHAAPLMSPLTHAVSRVNLICRNESARPDTLKVRFDVSGDGTRTNYHNLYPGTIHSGMPKRDYIYIRPPGENWQRINGYTEGWNTIVSFVAKPGETLVGLSPWYTYGNYISFVNGLQAGPYLKKSMLCRSDGGREHWMVTITDPDVPSTEKEVFLWFVRKHAYETFSSFAVEGVVEYLLSEEGKHAREKYIFYIIPMINVDGVAQGYEYKGGYKFPKPTSTMSARILFTVVDDVKPDYLIDWHNWGGKRALDGLWYTYKENGEPSRRAWDVFTQHYPSPRCVGHNWQLETNPIILNKYINKRTGELQESFPESDPDSRALNKYGAKEWGWEMPWWGRDEGDPAQNAKLNGRWFCKALLETIDILKKPAPAEYYEIKRTSLKAGEVFETRVSGTVHVDNPECWAVAIGEFTGPAGETTVVEGKFQGNDSWLVKFSPDTIGEWKYLIRGEGVEIFQRGRINCTD
ncbi:DUF5060 domain-containing protein [Bacteroidota bacterium]